jgi:hypothetical protein
MANIAGNLDFKFQYLFAVQICCLILRIAMMLQFQGNIGPLIKIVGKMVMDFFNYTLLFILLTIMFSIVGNINFIYDLKEFENFTNSVLTVIDASVGNFDTQMFSQLRDPNMAVVGQVYIISIVVCFNILLMNLIIAILASTFERFDQRSNGLYLSKILTTRDELNYDVSYGSVFSATPPLNAI